MSSTSPKKQNPKKRKNPWINKFHRREEPHIVQNARPAVNVLPDMTRGGFCPYRAWKNYFPMEVYSHESMTVATVKVTARSRM